MDAQQQRGRGDDMATMGSIVITCPTTNQQVNTAVRMTEETFTCGEFQGQQYHCIRCGQTHVWGKDNAHLAPSA